MEINVNIESILEEFYAKCPVKPGDLVVIGMSTSEIVGSPIGKDSHAEIGRQVMEEILRQMEARGALLAVQCCEHLNRALVVERETARKYSLEIVQAVPKPKAGGSGAAAAYLLMRDPVLAASVQADFGIDIGVTMIGMHLRPVVVPVRTEYRLGKARVDFAYSRPRLIGGERAEYN